MSTSRPPKTFKYRRKQYPILKVLKLRGRLYYIVEEWSSYVCKAFDPHVQAMRTIRFRKTGASTEMRILQRAAGQNPNLPRVLDLGRHQDWEYLVLEWVEGYTLWSYLRQGGPGQPYFTVPKSYWLTLGLVRGLHRLHKANIVHGDLKPANIVVRAESNRLIMIDFGTAWTGERAWNRPKQATAGYAAPEQWQDKALVDHRADQFAVSAMLFQMLTGELPYDGLGGGAVEFDVPPLLEPPSRKNADVWPAFDRVVTKALALDKNERYATSQAWIDDLELAKPPGEFGKLLVRQWNRAIDLGVRVYRGAKRRLEDLQD